MIFALRMLGDVALYFYFAGVIGHIAGSQTLFYFPLLWCTVSSALSYMLREKRWFVRCIPYALVGLSWFTIQHRVDAILLVLPLVYLLLTAARGLYEMERYEIVGRFKLLIKIMPVLLLGATIDRTTIEKFSLPYGLIYVFVAIYLMRLLRHEEEVLRQPRFLLLNGLGLVGVCLAGLMLTSPASVAGAKWILQNVLAPLLSLLAAAFLGIFLLFYRRFETGPHVMERVKMTSQTAEADKWQTAYIRVSSSVNADRIFIALVTIGVAVLLIVLMRRLLGRKRSAKTEDGMVQHRSNLVPQEKNKQRLQKGTPQNQIRITYQRFLKLCHRYGIDIPLWFTSENVSIAAASKSWRDEGESDQLREVYLKARYSEAQITAEDARQAANSFGKLRSRAKEVSRKKEKS